MDGTITRRVAIGRGTLESWLDRAVEHEREARWNVAAVLYRALIILHADCERAVRGLARCELVWGRRDRAGQVLAAGARARIEGDAQASIMMLEALALAPIDLEAIAEFVERVVAVSGLEQARTWFERLLELLRLRQREADARMLELWFSELASTPSETSIPRDPSLPRTFRLDQQALPPPRRMEPRVSDDDFDRARTRRRVVERSRPGDAEMIRAQTRRNGTAAYGQFLDAPVRDHPRPRLPQRPASAEGTQMLYPELDLAVGSEP